MRTKVKSLNRIIKESIKKVLSEKDEYYDIENQQMIDDFMRSDPEGFAEEYGIPLEKVYDIIKLNDEYGSEYSSDEEYPFE